MEVDLAANVHAELGPVLEGLRQGGELALLGRGQAGIPGQEGKLVEILGAARQGGQQREGRGDGFAEGVAEHIPEDVAEAEIRLIQIALHLEVHLDDTA